MFADLLFYHVVQWWLHRFGELSSISSTYTGMFELLDSRLFCRCDMAEPSFQPFGGGLAVAYTHRCPGKETSNEDSAAVIPYTEDSGLLVVADGVGGNRAGDRASALAVATLKAAVQYSNGVDSLRALVLDGIEQANDAILNLGIGAATTLCVMEVRGREIRPYHVGDSMMLVVGQRGKIKWQSIAHSPVGYAVESGMLDAHDAIFHEERHLVSNIVGTTDMRIEIGPQIKLAARDTILLASDGLFDNLQVDEVVANVRKGSIYNGIQTLADESHHRMVKPEKDVASKPDDMTIVSWRPFVLAADKKRADRQQLQSEQHIEARDLANVAPVLPLPAAG